MDTSWHNLQRIFDAHHIPQGQYVDLYHVYDNKSQTPFEHGSGIQCKDPDDYIMNAWHVFTPPAIGRHLDWRNRTPTQFISLYDNQNDAMSEAARRQRDGRRDPASVKIAHVRLGHDSKVWANSPAEVNRMMQTLGGTYEHMPARNEWIVWGVIPERLVVNRHFL